MARGDSIQGTFEAMDPKFIFQAVAETWDQYAEAKRHPGSGVYEWDTRGQRQNMVADVANRYRELSDLRGIFPYHDDQIVLLWIQYRKSRDAFRDACGL